MKHKNAVLLLGLLIALFACRPTADKQPSDNHKSAAGTPQVQSLYATDNQQKVVAYELPAPSTTRPEQILKRRGFTVSYNKLSKTPNWVAWHLTKAHTYGKFKREQGMFAPDKDTPEPQTDDWDYYNSRYDRGHMCPAGDNKWDKTALVESFLFSNICPQNHGLNKYEWNDVEMLCREWARKYGAIDIVCGPIFYGKGEQKTIGKHRVWVPDAFFKVVLCRKGSPKAIGFVYENKGVKQKMEDCIRTVDEVERITGFDFFPSLPDDIERSVERKANISEW